MADAKTGQVMAWLVAALFVVLLVMSFSMNGTWMGGMGMAWMMGGGVILLALAVYFAYPFGRMEQKLEDLEAKKP